jgi:hypothetical protein
MRAVENAPIAENPQLGSYQKIDIFLDKRISFVHYMFFMQRAGVASGHSQGNCGSRLKVDQAAEGENLDGRGQATQAGCAIDGVGERGRRTVRSAARDPRSPHGRGREFFLPRFARKLLIILDSGKTVAIISLTPQTT